MEVDEFDYNKTLIKHQCVETCSQDYEEVFNRCIKKSDRKKVENTTRTIGLIAKDFTILWRKILRICGIAAIMSYVTMLFIHFVTSYVIWIIYVLFAIGLLIGSVIFGVWYGQEGESAFLVLSILMAIFMIISVIIFLWFQKRIPLITQLFSEASQALKDVKYNQPWSSFLSIILSIIPFIYFFIAIEAAGIPEEKVNARNETEVIYERIGAMDLARILNIIAFFWFIQFIFGCQHFIVGGKKFENFTKNVLA